MSFIDNIRKAFHPFLMASVTGTMMAVNKLVSTSKQFNKNIKEIVVDPVIDKLGNIVVSDMNKRLKAPLT